MKLTIPRVPAGLGQLVRDRAATLQTEATNSAKGWNATIMSESAGKASHGTRWFRGVGVLIPSTAAVIGILSAIANGALAANFNVADKPIDLHIGRATAQGLTIVMNASNAKDEHGNVSSKGLLHAALGSAQIDGLCLIAKQSLLGVTYSVVLSVPKGPKQAAGNNVQFDVASLVAHDVSLDNTLIGKSADDITLNGQSQGGQPGGFGIDASNGTAVLNDVTGSAYGATILGSLTAPTFEASIKQGEATSC